MIRSIRREGERQGTIKVNKQDNQVEKRLDQTLLDQKQGWRDRASAITPPPTTRVERIARLFLGRFVVASLSFGRVLLGLKCKKVDLKLLEGIRLLVKG